MFKLKNFLMDLDIASDLSEQDYMDRLKYSKVFFGASMAITAVFCFLELLLVQLGHSTFSQSVSRAVTVGRVALVGSIASVVIENLRFIVSESRYSNIKGRKPGIILLGLFFGLNALTAVIQIIGTSGIFQVVLIGFSALFAISAFELFLRPKRGIKISLGVLIIFIFISIYYIYQVPEAYNNILTQFTVVVLAYIYPQLNDF